MQTRLLIATRLQRNFHGRQVVAPLELELTAGEILGLLGPNGAGKSTIMRMLSGDLAPDGGRIEIASDDLLLHPIAARRHIGFLPERPPLHPDQTVDEFLSDCARLRRLSRDALRAALPRVKRQCGLEGVGKRLIRKLSKGYRQRIGLAQAIIHDPRVVILDEPTDGLDPVQICQVRELIHDLAAGRGVILSSHILPEIQATCSRVMILQEGRCVYRGEIDSPVEPVYRVELEQDLPEKSLMELPTIASAEKLRDRCYRVTLQEGRGAGELSRRIVQRGWGLTELTPQVLSLEQRYLRATTGGEP